MNELEKLLVKSTTELQGIGGDIVYNAMGVEVEVVSCRIYWVMGQMNMKMRKLMTQSACRILLSLIMVMGGL